MKKLITVGLLAFLSLNACSGDDANDSSNNDPILGEWGNYKDTFIDDNGDEQLDTAYDPYYDVLTINSDGTITSENSFGGSFDGTWENTGGGNYVMSALGFTVTNSVEFLCDNNIMKWKDGDYGYFYYEKIGYDNASCDED